MKKNKYEYEYVLQGHYGQGWEDLTAAEKTPKGWREIRADLKSYRENEGGSYRIVNRRNLASENLHKSHSEENDMALTYDLQGIPFQGRTTLITDQERIKDIRKNGTGGLFPLPYYDTEDGFFIMSSVTHSLIFLTMSIGMGAITKKNWMEFYGRVRATEALHGAARNQWDEETREFTPVFIAPRDVKDHIGLSTNGGRMTVAKWRKNLLEGFTRDAERRAQSEAAGEASGEARHCGQAEA